MNERVILVADGSIGTSGAALARLLKSSSVTVMVPDRPSPVVPAAPVLSDADHRAIAAAEAKRARRAAKRGA